MCSVSMYVYMPMCEFVANRVFLQRTEENMVFFFREYRSCLEWGEGVV